ncbi:MAG: DUF1292 domain-containing protein [Firmicutes bacterium]|nr:DUF1292 domain-containing protein [Bacillota bacterium]
MEDNIIILEDENGNPIEFLPLSVYEFKDKIYCALTEVTEDGEEESDEVVIMRIEGEGDDAELHMVEDEKELEAAFDEFVRIDSEASEE